MTINPSKLKNTFNKIIMPYNIKIDKENFALDASHLIDAVQISESQFHVLQNNRAYQVEIIESDFASKQMLLKVNGTRYELSIKDEVDQLVEKLGFEESDSKKLKNIKAPMPGLIIDILVEKGQSVQQGDQLLILEAMKMENVLKAEGEGIVKEVFFTKGLTVNKGQIIIEME